MKIDIVHMSNIEDIPIDVVRVEPISESIIGDVKNLIASAEPSNRVALSDNAYALIVSSNNKKVILGVVCTEPNDIRTKHRIPWEDSERRNYHEITYILIDDRLFNTRTLVPLMRQILSMSVSDERVDEVYWFSDDRVYSQTVNRVIKTCQVYYFQNEAEYFVDKLISQYGTKRSQEIIGAFKCEFDEIYHEFGNEPVDESIESTTISAEELHEQWHRILDEAYVELYGNNETNETAPTERINRNQD